MANLIERRRPSLNAEIDYLSSMGEAEWELETNRNSREFVRWVQQSLNTVIGANLAVDGVIGPRTIDAIRRFQAGQRLAQDGIVGPNTEAALKSALAVKRGGGGSTGLPKPAAVLDRFAFDSDALQPHHTALLLGLARTIASARGTSSPVRSVRIVGFTDPSGSESYNLRLGERRASRVAAALRAQVQKLSRAALDGLTIATESRGESQATSDAASSRRVEVFLIRPLGPNPKPRPGPKPAPASTLDPARWTPIMRAPELRTGNAVDFLIDGKATFKAMHDAILTATGEGHYIYLLGWWLTDNFDIVPGPNKTIAKLFESASNRGVQIRAMLWDQVGRQNTAEVGRINGLRNGAAILDDQTAGRTAGVNVGSHHQKVLVVKGSKGLITFCGGLDFNKDRIEASASGSSSGSSGQQGNPQHDVHCRVVGPSAFDLLKTFIIRWDAHPGHAALDRAKGNLLGRSEAIPKPIPSSGSGQGTSGNCAVRITRTFNPVPPISPGSVKERTIRTTLISAIKNARRFIYMEDQYLINMEAAALLNAALSHLQHITIVIPYSDITIMPRVWEGRRNFIERLKRGPHGHKARVFFLATPPNNTGKPVFGRHTYVHAKTWVFDDELAVIGSANCNQRGWTNDSEVNAVIFEDRNPAGLTFAQRLRMQLWAEHLVVPASSLTDGVASASRWARIASVGPDAKAKVRPYDPAAGSDPFRHRAVPWSAIDPRA